MPLSRTKAPPVPRAPHRPTDLESPFDRPTHRRFLRIGKNCATPTLPSVR